MIIALPGKFTGTGEQRVVRHAAAYNELDSVVLTPVLDPIHKPKPNSTILYAPYAGGGTTHILPLSVVHEYG